MGCNLDIIGEAGLQFFGTMTASITHELKNVLAVINENAGLLEDLILMAEKGRPIAPERLKTLAGTVRKQIRRADEIVKNMNRFAHSADEPMKSVDVGEIVGLAATLSHRHATMHGVTLEPRPHPSPLMITTNPFFLENLLWLCLVFAMNAAGGSKTVGLIWEKMEKGVTIRLTCLEGLAEQPGDRFPAEQEKALLRALKAELRVDIEAGELIITLPGGISSGVDSREPLSKED
ncbi:MAG: histidine kinase dimerization/phospho-acceptor domain-containing protein [Pseudomonadota bacterium]